MLRVFSRIKGILFGMLLITAAFINGDDDFGDFYSSVASLENLLHTESILVKDLREYLETVVKQIYFLQK